MTQSPDMSNDTAPPALADSVNLDEGWALLEKATPGPWEWNDCDGCLVDTGKPRNWPANEPWRHEWLIDCDCPWWAPVDGSKWKRDAFQSVSEELTAEQTANARLIVYAVNNLPALLSAVAALERERDELRRLCGLDCDADPENGHSVISQPDGYQFCHKCGITIKEARRRRAALPARVGRDQ